MSSSKSSSSSSSSNGQGKGEEKSSFKDEELKLEQQCELEDVMENADKLIKSKKRKIEMNDTIFEVPVDVFKARSAYFSGMFCGNFKETARSTKRIKIELPHPELADTINSFLQTGYFHPKAVTAKTVFPLMSTFQFLQVESAMNKLIESLRKSCLDSEFRNRVKTFPGFYKAESIIILKLESLHIMVDWAERNEDESVINAIVNEISMAYPCFKNISDRLWESLILHKDLWKGVRLLWCMDRLKIKTDGAYKAKIMHNLLEKDYISLAELFEMFGSDPSFDDCMMDLLMDKGDVTNAKTYYQKVVKHERDMISSHKTRLVKIHSDLKVSRCQRSNPPRLLRIIGNARSYVNLCHKKDYGEYLNEFCVEEIE